MRVNKKAKILDYAAGFFLLVYILLIFFKLTQGDYFYLLPAIFSFVLFLLLFDKYKKMKNSQSTLLSNSPKIDMSENSMEIEKEGSGREK